MPPEPDAVVAIIKAVSLLIRYGSTSQVLGLGVGYGIIHPSHSEDIDLPEDLFSIHFVGRVLLLPGDK